VISGSVKPMTFDILLSDPSVERGSYIKLKHDVYGWVLARIEYMKRYLDDFDDEITMATARTVGYKKDGSIMIPKTPFKPEEKVYKADNVLITDVLGLKSKREGNIYLGFLEGHDIPVYLDVKRTIGRHMSLLAKTGAGKSYTVAVVLEELMKNKVPIVIIDPHGEYGSLRVENDDYDNMLKYNIQSLSYVDRITEYAVNTSINPGAKKITLKPSFDMLELTEIMPMSLGDRQKSILYEALKRLEGTEYTLTELIGAVEEDSSKAKWKVLSDLEALEESGIFGETSVSATDLIKAGHASIINLKGTEPHIQELLWLS